MILVFSLSARGQNENLDQQPNEPPYTNSDELDLGEPSPQSSGPAKDPGPLSLDAPVNSSESAQQPSAHSPEPHKINHPNASKGLYLIDRTTGKYYYKTETKTKKEKSFSLRVGTYEAPSITATTSVGDISFSDVYDESAPPFLLFDYELPLFKKFKQLSLQMGTGFFLTQGRGVLQVAPTPPATGFVEAKEQYTFIAIPLNLGLIFRFEFANRQWIVPYVAGGGTYFGLIETRDDGKDTSVIGSPAAYGAGGLMLNLTAFDKQTAFIFDREYGINSLWLTAEFRLYQSFSDDLDMSSNVINFGVTVDY